MKNSTVISAIIVMLTALALSFANAGTPQYKISAENLTPVSANAFEFDIYLMHLNPDESKFEYILGQYFFDFNPVIANGGTLTYSIIGSELPQMFQPRNPTVSGNQLKLAVNSVPPKNNLPQISAKSPGTLIARMRLETSSKSFSGEELNLRLRSGPENPFSKVFAYKDNLITELKGIDEISADNNSIVKEVSAIPTEFALQQNYPNPFNPSTAINYDLPVGSFVTMKIFDITGREIATLVNEMQNAGSYNIRFDGSNFASGVYFYRIQAGEFTQLKKMFLIK